MRLMVCVCLTLLSISAMANDKLVKLEGIKIKADNEAPQVMYIIPWQNPKGAERLYSPVRSAKVERLKPLDPYTFELETDLHHQWKNQTKSNIDLVKD